MKRAQSGSGVPPLHSENQSRDGSATLTAAPPVRQPASPACHPELVEGSLPLPAGWKRTTLGQCCDLLAGYGFPERLQGKTEGDLAFFKVGDISEAWKRGDVFLTKANHYLSRDEAASIRAKPLPAHTTVFAKIGAAIALNRRAILSAPSLVDNNVMGVHPATNDLDAKYLFHFVCTLKLDELSRATTVPSVRKSDIESIPLPLPPLPAQRRIVAEIEKQFTRLEAGVAALRRVQANLHRYRAAVLKAACEGRLVPTEAETRKTFETGAQLLQRILKQRREQWTGKGKYKEPAAPDTTNLPKLPEGWCWATAEQLSDENRAITYGVIKLGEDVSDGVSTLRSSDVRHLRLDLEGVKRISPKIAGNYRRTFLQGGEILVTVRGTLGGVVVAPKACKDFNISREVAMIALVEPRIAPVVALFIGSNPVQNWLLRRTRGIAYTGINIATLKELPVPLPPVAEQERIVAEVERRLSVVEELSALVTANLQRATRLRQAIVQKAFTGELV